MMSKGDILLTAADLLRWREEDKQLDEQIRRLQQQRAEVRRKLEAAEVFAHPVPASDVDAPAPGGPRADDQDAKEGSESPPQALRANLLKTGDSLNIKQIKARLIELGFGDRLKAQPNYHYQLVYRLHKGDKLLRRGNRYRAAPISSPEGETEALGASVHP